MRILHGNVQGRPAIPHPAYDRYVAVLDVLGMKAWLEVATPQAIAEKLDEALAACDQACSGSVDGRRYGPLLGTTHFSDTLLVWSPDDLIFPHFRGHPNWRKNAPGVIHGQRKEATSSSPSVL